MPNVVQGGTAWIKGSIMKKRGVGRKRKSVTHQLTEAKQGQYHYTMGPYSNPVLHINPGDRVAVETRDAFEGKLKKETDKPSKLLKMPFVNPQNGPIMVDGAEKGDALAVLIESMLPRGRNPRGTCCLIPEFGALTGTYYTATLNDPLCMVRPCVARGLGRAGGERSCINVSGL
jgi:amidase